MIHYYNLLFSYYISTLKQHLNFLIYFCACVCDDFFDVIVLINKSNTGSVLNWHNILTTKGKIGIGSWLPTSTFAKYFWLLSAYSLFYSSHCCTMVSKICKKCDSFTLLWWQISCQDINRVSSFFKSWYLNGIYLWKDLLIPYINPFFRFSLNAALQPIKCLIKYTQ